MKKIIFLLVLVLALFSSIMASVSMLRSGNEPKLSMNNCQMENSGTNQDENVDCKTNNPIFILPYVILKLLL